MYEREANFKFSLDRKYFTVSRGILGLFNIIPTVRFGGRRWVSVKTFTLYLFDAVDSHDDEASTEPNMADVPPIPKIVTTPIKEDMNRDEEDSRDEWGRTDVDMTKHNFCLGRDFFKINSHIYLHLFLFFLHSVIYILISALQKKEHIPFWKYVSN